MDGVFSSPAGRFQAHSATSASSSGRNMNMVNSSAQATQSSRFEPIQEMLSLTGRQPENAQAWRTVAWSIASALRDSRDKRLPTAG